MTQQEAQTTALVQVNPASDDKVKKLYEAGVKLKGYAELLVIHSDEDIAIVTDDLAAIAGLKKSIEEERNRFTVPLNDFLKSINTAFKDFTAPLDEADRITRGKVLAYKKEQAKVSYYLSLLRLKWEVT